MHNLRTTTSICVWTGNFQTPAPDPTTTPTVSASKQFHPPCRVGNINAPGAVGLRGMAASRDHWGVIYITSFHSNSQDDNIIHTVEAKTGNILGSVTVLGASPSGWTDLAIGPCSESDSSSCIYILDSNGVVKLREPSNPRGSSTANVIDTISLTTNGEQKSLFVGLDGSIYSMNAPDYGFQIRMNRINPNGVSTTTVSIPSASPGPRSADLSPDGTELLVLMADNVFRFTVSNNNIKDALSSDPEILPITPFPTDFKLTWSPTAKGYYLGTGNSLTGEVTLYYSARCGDVPSETETFSEGQVVGTVGVSGNGRISGLAASRQHPGYLYVTSAGDPNIYILDTLQNGQLTATLSSSNSNLKDVAVADCQIGTGSCVYVVDDVSKTIFSFPEPGLLINQSLTLDSIVFTSSVFMFFSRSLFVSPNNTIYLLEWEFQNYVTGVNVFELQSSGGSWKAETVATFYPKSAREGPEAADISPDGLEILVKMRDRVALYNVTDGDVVGAFKKEPEYLPYLPERRGNSIAWSNDGSSYFTIDSETGVLRRYDRL